MSSNDLPWYVRLWVNHNKNSTRPFLTRPGNIVPILFLLVIAYFGYTTVTRLERLISPVICFADISSCFQKRLDQAISDIQHKGGNFSLDTATPDSSVVKVQTPTPPPITTTPPPPPITTAPPPIPNTQDTLPICTSVLHIDTAYSDKEEEEVLVRHNACVLHRACVDQIDTSISTPRLVNKHIALCDIAMEEYLRDNISATQPTTVPVDVFDRPQS